MPAHLRLRLLPDGKPVISAVVTVGGTEIEEGLVGVLMVEFSAIETGSLMKIHMQPQTVDIFNFAVPRAAPEDTPPHGDSLAPARH